MAGAASESTPSSPRVSLPMNIGDACVAAVAAQEEKSASTSTEHEVLEEDEAIYNKFSKSVKRRVLIITASSELALECSVFAFLPSIKPIADELNTTPSVINLTISLFV